MPAKIEIGDYVKTNWAVKLTNERTAETVANQTFDAFREKVYKKYMDRFAETNQIKNKRVRNKKLVALQRRMRVDVDQFFNGFRETSLKSLTNATLAAKRIQYNLLEDDPPRARKQVRASRVRERGEKRKLQIGTGKLGSTHSRHTGSSAHVQRRLVQGLAREMKQAVPGQVMQTRRRTREWIKTVARTEANAAMADADIQAIKESFDEYRYVAVLDEWTSDRCASLDGEVFPINDGPKPPQHFNCRSEVQPLTGVERTDKILERAAKVKFDKMLADASPAVQARIVGKANMPAYRAGTYNPPPRWHVERKFPVSRKTGLPTIARPENMKRIRIAVDNFKVNYDPSVFK